MSKFTGIPCSYCHKPFTDTDDIVVCPVCGAPHHRDCYQKLGHCACEENHASGKAWKSPEQQAREEQQDEHDDDSILCPICQTYNPRDGIFCQMCGAPLKSDIKPPKNKGPYQQGGDPFIRSAANGSGAVHIVFNPYGGLNPNDTIDDVTVKEVAAYVGPSSGYYLPRFKQLSEGKSSFCWSWSGCFCNFIYFLYRKVYPVAVIAFLLLAVAMVPTFIASFKLAELMMDPSFTQSVLLDLPADITYWLNLETYFRFGILFMAVVFGFFSTRIYKHHVIKKIKKIKTASPALPESELIPLLMKKGGVNKKVITVLLILIIAINLISLFTLMTPI